MAVRKQRQGGPTELSRFTCVFLTRLAPRSIHGRQGGVEVSLLRPGLGELLLQLGLLPLPPAHVHGELVVLLLEDGLAVGPPRVSLERGKK